VIAFADALLSVLIPAPCAACGDLLDHPSRGPVCEGCWRSILPLTPPLCDVCGDPLCTWRTPVDGIARCVRCRRARRAVDRARAIGAYDGSLRAIVHALKYDGRRCLAWPLADLMQQRGGDILSGVEVAIPVPLHWSRRKQRGFNQSADLARHIGVPVVHALRRVRATAPQVELPAARRHKNVSGAFVATRAASSMRNSTVVLIDDVTTTGATLEACARALKENGIREVRALTAARVVGRASTSGPR